MTCNKSNNGRWPALTKRSTQIYPVGALRLVAGGTLGSNLPIWRNWLHTRRYSNINSSQPSGAIPVSEDWTREEPGMKLMTLQWSKQRTPPPPESQKHQADYANSKYKRCLLLQLNVSERKKNTPQAVELLENLHRIDLNATLGKFSFILLTFNCHVYLCTLFNSSWLYSKIEKYFLKNLLVLNVS